MKLVMNSSEALQEAALLLQVVAKIAASEEVGKREAKNHSRGGETYSDESSNSQNPKRRIRTVSLSSRPSPAVSVSRPLMSPPPLSFALQDVKIEPSFQIRSVSPLGKVLPSLMTLTHCKHSAPDQDNLPRVTGSKKGKYVGTHTSHRLKGILKRKFSWKNYPELEYFLLENRDDYLRHSSAYNYTSMQKEFNNKLTAELVELALSHGYVFERFTFVEVRDRIRCYYKSYLQSKKKCKENP